MTRNRLFAAIVLLGLLAAGFSLRQARRSDTSGMPDLVLSVPPTNSTKDPGPTQVAGSESEAAGTHFIGADLHVDGAGDVRVYFDRRDNANFHYLDRTGDTVTLGLCEAGLEQLFARGKLDGNAPLRIARHGAHIGVFQQSKLLLSAFDDRLLGGSAGVRLLNGGAAVSFRAEPREEVHFADDFMISEGKGAQWLGNGTTEKGDFSVKSLRHPLLSANAFSYLGAGKNIYSVAGQSWWDQYRYEASLRGPVNGSIGLVFAYHDDKNYGLFKWTARKSDAAGVVDAGKRELIRVKDGQSHVIAEAAGGYLADQWYAAQLHVTYARVSILIDGHPMLDASDAALCAGAVGVWCDVSLPVANALDPRAQAFQENSLNELMKQHAVFDDIRVNTLEGYEDDFRSAGALGSGWLVGTGDWSVKTPDSGELTVMPAKGSTKALVGDRRWAQYVIEGRVQPGEGSAGIVFLHRDESNYFSAVVDQKTLKLVCVLDRKEEIVDSIPIQATGKPIRLQATVKHGHVKVTADGGSSVEYFAGDAMLRGRAGFIAAAGREQRATPASFSRFKLSFLPEAEPLVTTNAVFEDELTMADWTSPTSEWYPPRDQIFVDGRPVNLLWHRSQFPGDVELVVEPREYLEAKFELALSVAKDGQGKNNGYVFKYKAGDSSEGPSRTSTVQLIRQGEVVKEAHLSDDPRQLSTVALRHCGKYIVGMINGRPVASYRDDQPLSGSKVAYYTQGIQVRTEATKIISNNFRNDLFSSAATAWRTAGAAIAEVTNRWQCDPRWSFFSLKNDKRRGKPAVLWSKGLYPGDVTVEFYCANKMEAERGQPYSYARDINVTIASDGTDLTKGYTFMFGGMNNQGSMVLRNGVEVKRVGARIPMDMNFHRHWFSIKIEKQGGRLSFRVDRFFANDKSSDLVYEDSVPLEGNRIAIWTYDHALMISRVRISGEGGSVLENPDYAPGVLKTPLDDK